MRWPGWRERHEPARAPQTPRDRRGEGGDRDRAVHRRGLHQAAEVREDAEELGCLEEILHARTILSRGTSATRQLQVYRVAREAGRDEQDALRAVVDHILEETVADLPEVEGAPAVEVGLVDAPHGMEALREASLINRRAIEPRVIRFPAIRKIGIARRTSLFRLIHRSSTRETSTPSPQTRCT